MSILAQGSTAVRLFQLFFPFLICFANSARSLDFSSEDIPPNDNSSRTTETRHSTEFLDLSISFEENHGQVDPRIKFISRGGTYTLLLTQEETMLVVHDNADLSEQKTVLEYAHMKLLNANTHAELTGGGRAAGEINYLIGRYKEHWRTNIPSYSEIRAEEIYPGIDLRYHGDQRQLEYDFIISPGASPDAIKLEFTGLDDLTIDDEGNLLLTTSGGVIKQRKPIIYQDINGKRIRIETGYRLSHDQSKKLFQVGFEVAAYDQQHPLIIDPIMEFASYIGGEGDDQGLAMTLDDQGYIYIAGATNSLTLPEGFQPINTLIGIQDSFITKISPDGQSIIYTTYLGGSGYRIPHHRGEKYPKWDENDDDTPWWEVEQRDHDQKQANYDKEQANGIAVTKMEEVLITGITNSNTDFPLVQPIQSQYGGGTVDSYVAKLSEDGSEILFSTYLGGADTDTGIAVALDSSENIIIAGNSNSKDFPTMKAIQNKSQGGQEIVITQLSADGQLIQYSTYLGGRDEDTVKAMILDSKGNLVLTGYTRSWDFPITFDAYQSRLGGVKRGFNQGNGTYDAILTRLQADGQSLIYSTYLGGTGFDMGTSIASDGQDKLWLAGNTTSSRDFPVTGAVFQSRYGGGLSNGFVARFDMETDKLEASGYLGDSSFVGMGGIAHGSDESLWIAINTRQQSISKYRIRNPLPGEKRDILVTKVNADLSLILTSITLGGQGDDLVHATASDQINGIYIAGTTRSQEDFPVVNAFQPFFGGGRQDTFFVKLIDETIISNHSPVITSSPITSALVGENYKYDVDAVDQDGDKLSYSLVRFPDDMLIDVATGLITWRGFKQGAYDIEVNVSDSQGNHDAQIYTLTVPNRAPVFTSEPPDGEINVTDTFFSTVTAFDEDNDPLTFSFTVAPEGIQIDPQNGIIIWAHPAVGEHVITLQVDDGNGGGATQTFTLTVTDSPAIYSNPATITQSGVRYFYETRAYDPNNSPLTFTLNTAPSGMTLDSDTGFLEWTPSSAGIFEVEILASNGRGQTAIQDFVLRVYSSNDIIIVSNPQTEGYVATAYQYQVSVINFADDTVMYSLANPPAGMTIDPVSGIISWTPAISGEFLVTVNATNGRKNRAAQSYFVNVSTLEEMDATFNRLWTEMYDDLVVGDKDAVMQKLTGEAQRKYGPVFDRLMPYMKEIVANYTPLVRMSINPEIAEYLVRRIHGDSTKVYIISFIRDFEGEWKLNEM